LLQIDAAAPRRIALRVRALELVQHFAQIRHAVQIQLAGGDAQARVPLHRVAVAFGLHLVAQSGAITYRRAAPIPTCSGTFDVNGAWI